MAAGNGAGATGVGVAGGAVAGDLSRGAAATASCVAGPDSPIGPENFKLWAEHLLRARGDDPVNGEYLEGDAVAMGYFGQTPIYERFGGPWCPSPLQMHDVDWDPPPEYRINSTIKDKLAPVDLRLYGDDVLFYTFYAFVSEALQILAANELYLRGWRFHTQRRVWLRQTSRSWAIFEPWSWQVVERDLDIDLTLLERLPFPPESYGTRSPASETEREVPIGGAAPARPGPGVPRVPVPRYCHVRGAPAARPPDCRRPQFEWRQGECPEEARQECERPPHCRQPDRQHRVPELQRQRWQVELQHGQGRQMCDGRAYWQQSPNFQHAPQVQLQHDHNRQQATLPSDYRDPRIHSARRQLQVQYHHFGGNVPAGLLPSHRGVAPADGAVDGRTSVAATVVPPDCRVTI